MEKLIKILEKNGWEVTQFDDGNIDIEQYSNLGEDLIEEIECKNEEEFIKEFENIVENFDIDEHVELYIHSRGRHGVPNCTVQELLDDAKEIKQLYERTLNDIKGEKNVIENHDLNYIIFILGRDLLKDKMPIENDLAYDYCKKVATLFDESEYNDSSKSLYECLAEYVKDKIL